MQSSTITVISLIINFGFIILVLSLFYPKAIQLYRKRKKQAETKRIKEIQSIVMGYLKEISND